MHMPDGPPVVAFDVGGTHVRCVVVGDNGILNDFEKGRICSVPNGASLEDVKSALIDTIARYVERVSPDIGASSPVAISVPGPVDRDGVVYTAAPLFADLCPSFPLARLVTERTGRACHVVNDVSAATWYLSTRILVERFLVVTVSSGIGSKVFDRSRRFAVLDDTEYAGEIGHVTVDAAPDAPLCDCGGRGHLSAFSSGRAVERWGRLLASRDAEGFRSSLASELCAGDADTLTNEKHIVPAVLSGDEWATDLLRRCTYPLAHMLRTVAVTNAVQKIAVIGGSLLASAAAISIFCKKLWTRTSTSPFCGLISRICSGRRLSCPRSVCWEPLRMGACERANPKSWFWRGKSRRLRVNATA